MIFIKVTSVKALMFKNSTGHIWLVYQWFYLFSLAKICKQMLKKLGVSSEILQKYLRKEYAQIFPLINSTRSFADNYVFMYNKN